MRAKIVSKRQFHEVVPLTEDVANEREARTTVFLSYSRRDSDFRGRLSEALVRRGFSAIYDQSDRPHEDPDLRLTSQDEWWKQLKAMIAASDVMVFVISPDSAGSLVCDDEIAHARALGKRVVPVLRRSIDLNTAPERLRVLNVGIDFRDDADHAFDSALELLCAELKHDMEWHRTGTRLARQADLWERAGRTVAHLLRAGAIAEADAWAFRRPANAPEPGTLLAQFLESSRSHEEEQRRQLLAAVGAGYVMPIRNASQAGHHDFAIRMLATGCLKSEDLDFRITPELWQVGAQAIYSNRLIGRIRPLADEGKFDAVNTGGTAVNSDGSLVATFAADQTLSIWQTNDGHCVWRSDPFGAWSWSVYFVDKGTLLLVLNDGRLVRIEIPGFRWRVVHQEDDGLGFGVARFVDGTLLVSKRNHTLLSYVPRSGSIARFIGHDDHVLCSDYNGGVELVVTGSADNSIILWSPRGEKLRKLSGHKDQVNDVRFNSDGSKIISGSGGMMQTTDRSVRLWSTLQDAQSAILAEHDYRVNAVAHCPMHSIGASASNDRTLRLYNTETLETIAIVRPELERVTELAFSPDGSRLVAGGDLGRLALVAPRTGDIIARLDRHDHSVQFAAFSADGSRVVSSSLDMSVSVWDARLSDRAILDETHAGPSIHSFVPKISFDRSQTRSALAHRNNTASVVRVKEPRAEIVHLKDVERGIEDIGFVDGDEMYFAPNNLVPSSRDRFDFVWTSGRAGMPGIALWDITRSRALLFRPLVVLAAALSNGIGKLAGNEKNGILFRNTAEDLYAEVLSKLTDRDRDLVSKVAQILRQKQHPGCYNSSAASQRGGRSP